MEIKKADPTKVVSDVVDQQQESRKWFSDNYYGELEEIYRNIRCRTEPLKDSKGNEIKDRTNVCMPDHAVMVQRQKARLTVNPPNLRFRGGTQEARDKATALTYFQWERSKQQRVLKEVVHQGVAFGWSLDKTWIDEVSNIRRLRRKTNTINREQLLGLQGMDPDKIGAVMDQLGPDLNDGELEAAISEHGAEVSLLMNSIKYSGPVTKRIFIGDIFPEPGFKSLSESGWITESYMGSVTWLKHMQEMEYEDPETGETVKVFNPEAAKELEDIEPRGLSGRQDQELRERLRSAIQQSNPDVEPRLRGKRWSILERHMFVKGRLVIDWIAEEKLHLGHMVYPYDTYGRPLYNELILIPDILGGWGDSGTRISRFLMQLKNSRSNQSTDFVNQKMRPVYWVSERADMTDQAIVRTAYGNFIVGKDATDKPEPLYDPNYPPESWFDLSNINREFQQVAPETADFASQSPGAPQAGKLATGLVQQARATDVLTEDKLGNLNLYLKDLLELRFSLTQQSMEEAVSIEPGDIDRVDALLTRHSESGDARSIVIDPMEIQEDMNIEPEIGSTLAVDDEYKTAAAERFFMLAAANPDVFNKREAARKLASTIPGIKVDEALVQEQPEQGPDIRFNVSLNVKWPELPADVRKAALEGMGLPTEDLEEESDLVETPMKLAEAAEHVDRLSQPVGLDAEEGNRGAPSGGRGASAGGKGRTKPGSR